MSTWHNKGRLIEVLQSRILDKINIENRKFSLDTDNCPEHPVDINLKLSSIKDLLSNVTLVLQLTE